MLNPILMILSQLETFIEYGGCTRLRTMNSTKYKKDTRERFCIEKLLQKAI